MILSLNMKICICTTPIRPIPTTFPPFGSLAIIQSLRKISVDCEFYNIDYFRPSKKDIVKHFEFGQYDIVLISAVVSTAYAFTKYLASTIKSTSPKTIIIVGGNLAASAEILLRFANIDFCVVGDGEFIIQDLVSKINELIKTNNVTEKDLYKNILGISYIDIKDKFCFTGFGRRPNADEVEVPDYNILKKDGSLEHFISPNHTNKREWIDKSGYYALVISAKGCVARCTFCHRWEKGYRVQPEDKTINLIKDLIQNYKVTHIEFGDENFGADREFTRSLVKRLGKLNITWGVGGVRVRTVTLDDMRLWKENGCTHAYFGIESGSPKILEIMEKNATLEENINALRFVSECRIETIVQLVVGMPGEDENTINETIAFLNKITEFNWKENYPSDLVSINYAQALPGTPLYEWAREKKFLGESLQDEENYLIKISDVDAYKEDHFINYTGLPLLKVLAWRPLILSRIDEYYVKEKLKIKKTSLVAVFTYFFKLLLLRFSILFVSKINIFFKKLSINLNLSIPITFLTSKQTGDFESGYFNIHGGLKFFILLLNPLTSIFFYPALLIFSAFKTSRTPLHFLFLFYEYFIWKLSSKEDIKYPVKKESLRKIIILKKEMSDIGYKDPMDPLRLGR